MNSQELSALQEAYNQVYELDEAKVDKDKTMVQKIQSRNERSGIDSTPQRRLRTQAMRGIGKGGGFQSRSNPQRINNSYDLFDVILSHLLDEGYADTEQAAEAIMVNMSEEWRESIVEGKKPYPAEKVKNSLMKKSEYIGYEDQGGRAERESERGEKQYQIHKKMMRNNKD